MPGTPEPLAAVTANGTDAAPGMEYNGAEGHETDTVASIIAEMRDTWTDTPPSALLDLADRLEAAVARERNAHTNDVHDALYMATGIPGNAAAMREALEKIADMKFHLGDFAEPVNGDSSAIYENAKWDGKKFLGREIPAWWGAGWRESLSRAIDTARAALAAPARNCDRFATVGAAHRAWRATDQERDFADWLFAPAEGGDHA